MAFFSSGATARYRREDSGIPSRLRRISQAYDRTRWESTPTRAKSLSAKQKRVMTWTQLTLAISCAFLDALSEATNASRAACTLPSHDLWPAFSIKCWRRLGCWAPDTSCGYIFQIVL